MREPDVIVIGGGQAGLAMSQSLTARGIEHVVFERGRVGERWHSQRWPSLCLLTPNALSALPGMQHTGHDPSAFMPAHEFASYLTSYALAMNVPVIGGVEVTRVERTSYGYRVSTSAGPWRSRVVVIATGACNTPMRPAMAGTLHPSILSISPSDYRQPRQLPDGGVLVVGASATGIQLAEEIHASGRPVVLSVGNHTRVPRRYRGRDLYAWMDTSGILDDPILDTGNRDFARRQPSLQLIGSSTSRDLDLGVLHRQGVQLVGRLSAIDSMTARFRGDLAQTTASSQARKLRILDRIDDYIANQGLCVPAAAPRLRLPLAAAGDDLTLNLRRAGIRSVVWATGYIRRYPWLDVSVLDHSGEIMHRGGITAAPGLYALGLTFLRRRRSSLISGCGLDAEDLAPAIKAHLDRAAIAA